MTTVSNTDESIVYDGSWTAVTDFLGTTHQTSTVGDSASLTFTGVQVSIVGNIPLCAASTAVVAFIVTVDSGTPQSGSFACSSEPSNNVVLYQSSTLNFGSHTVTIGNFGSSLPLVLDDFVYQAQASSSLSSASTQSAADPPSSTASPTSKGATTPSSSSTSAGSASSPLGGSTSNAGSGLTSAQVTAPTSLNGVTTSFTTMFQSTGNSSDSSSGVSHTPSRAAGSHLIGPIVGGVVSGIVVVLFCLFWLLRHRRRRNSSVDIEHPPAITRPETITPFSDVSQQNLALFILDKPSLQIPEEVLSPSSSSSPLSSPVVTPFVDEKRPPSPAPSQSPHASGSTSTSTSPPQAGPSTLSVPEASSSVSPSDDAVPAYVGDPNGIRIQRRSGMSALGLGDGPRTSQILDMPPSYDSVRDADLRTERDG